jgi:hypothetical protein
MFSTLSPWTRAVLARSPIPSKFSPRSVSSSTLLLLQYLESLISPSPPSLLICRTRSVSSDARVHLPTLMTSYGYVLPLRRRPDARNAVRVCALRCSSLLTTLVDVFHSVRHRLCTRSCGCVGSCPSRTRACTCALIGGEKP